MDSLRGAAPIAGHNFPQRGEDPEDITQLIGGESLREASPSVGTLSQHERISRSMEGRISTSASGSTQELFDRGGELTASNRDGLTERHFPAEAD